MVNVAADHTQRDSRSHSVEAKMATKPVYVRFIVVHNALGEMLVGKWISQD
jgi:hypothetical protein